MDIGKLMSKVAIDSNGCWLWQGGKTYDGYARVHAGGKTRRVHRLMYQYHKGPIPEGLQLDHLCRVRHCVNPNHLEAVTARENLMRGETIASGKLKLPGFSSTHCPHGHEYTPENTYIRPNGGRYCRTCERLSKAKYLANFRR